MHRDSGDIRVAYLTNNITPHSLPLLFSLSSKVKELTVLTSTPLENNATINPEAKERFRIVHQRNISLRRVRHHPQGYFQEMHIHIPYDTVLQLIMRRPAAVISLEFGIRTLQALLYRFLNPSSRLIVWAPVSERTEQGRGKLRDIVRRFILRKADAVLVNGNSGFRYVRQLGAESRMIFKVPYTTDIELFGLIPPTRSRTEMRRLLYIGQLIDLKGLVPFMENLIRWLGLHPTEIIEFELVGEGPVRKRLEEIQLPENLTLVFLGQSNYRDLPAYYTKAGIFVFPTLGDEWGLVVNEAMMTGLPVLGSLYSQAVEELVEDGVNGWTFTPDDPQSLYRSLDLIMSSSYAQMEEMRNQARRSAAKLTPEYAAQQIAASLNSVFKS